MMITASTLRRNSARGSIANRGGKLALVASDVSDNDGGDLVDLTVN